MIFFYRNLESNPFNCNCHMSWLSSWLKKSKVSAGEPTCFLPTTHKNSPLLTLKEDQFICPSRSNYIVEVKRNCNIQYCEKEKISYEPQCLFFTRLKIFTWQCLCFMLLASWAMCINLGFAIKKRAKNALYLQRRNMRHLRPLIMLQYTWIYDKAFKQTKFTVLRHFLFYTAIFTLL